MRFLELRNCTTCGVKKVQRAWVLQIGFSTNLSRLQQGPFSQKQKDFIAVTSKKEDKLYCKIPFVVSIFKKIGEDCKNRRNDFINAIFPYFHGVWKSQKMSHSTLRAERATFTFWVDKKLIKNAKNGPFWRVFENLKLAVKQCYQTGQF